MRALHTSKVLSVEAASGLVRPGAVVFVGGMLLSRRPVAFCRALAERGARDLEVVAFTAGVETEILVEAGCVGTLRACYAGLEVYGPSARIRAAAESGAVRLVDETELTIVAGLQAAVLGLPWFPSARGIVGTDYPRLRPDIGTLRDPGSGQKLLTLPPIRPDVAVIHVPWADRRGNAIFHSGAAVDHAATCAAEVTIVTAERVVSEAELREIGACDLLGFQVQHVVEAAGGAHPTACLPHYEHDRGALMVASLG